MHAKRTRSGARIPQGDNMNVIRRKSRSFRLAACLALGAIASSWGGGQGLISSAQAAEPIQIKVLSNRADFVSGGDALVEMILPPGLTSSGLQVGVARTSSGPFTMVSSAFTTRT